MSSLKERWPVTGYRKHDVDRIILPAVYVDPDNGW